MIIKKILHKNKKIFWIPLILSLLLFAPKISLGGEGDIFWEQADDLTTGTELAYGVAVDSNYVYAVGYQGNMDFWRVEKRDINDGTVKWSVAEDFTPGAKDVAMEIDVDSTAMYIAGTINNWSEWRIEKRSLGGEFVIWSYEKSFTPGEKDEIAGIDIDSTGVYLAGSEDDESVWRVEKRKLDDGSPMWDARIASEGFADGIIVDSTGMYVVGTQDNNLMRVEKRNLDNGTLIWEKTPDFGPGADVAYEVVADSTGIYLACSQDNNFTWRVEKRNLDNGTLIWEQHPNLSFSKDMAFGIGVSSTGVYVSGYQGNGSIWRVEKRNLDDGGLEWKREEDFPEGTNWSHQLDFYSDGLYVVGHQGNRRLWRVERREKIPETLNLSVSLSADPASGNIPLNDIDLTATVNGTITGNINYTFYCDRDDDGIDITPLWDAKYDDISELSKKAIDLCDYASGGSYTAKVIVERGSLVAQDKVTINAIDSSNHLPVARTSCNPASCIGFDTEPFLLINNSFDSDSTNPPDNDNHIVYSEWFIDNDSRYSCNYANGCNLTTNNYVGAGFHTAKLYVQDASGGTSTAVKNFRIKKDLKVDFMCSADNNIWENCESFKITERETFFLKDVSTISDGAGSVLSRKWKKGGVPFGHNSANPSLVATPGNMIIKLEVTDNAGRTGIKTHTVYGKIFKLRWKETLPF
ncbi:MAG: hypothetical protein U9Q16_00705 [Patescibacteria group bacterium]|nr:hypothetical protein [Patescibacteria group bacterium]